MTTSIFLSLAALAALLPAALAPAGRAPQDVGQGASYWALIGVAVAGPAAWVAVQQSQAWQTGVGAALWLAIAVTMILFAGLAAINPVARRLTALLLGYLSGLGLLATIWLHAPARPLSGLAPAGWLQVHILVSVVAYGLLTLAAVAGAAVVLNERALKLKRPTAFTRQLPAVAEGEALQARLLVASAVVLGVALATGAALMWRESGTLLQFDHKTVLSIATFVVIVVLLWLHHRVGLSGRRAARYILVAYLLLTLAYPGVKFVTDVLMS
ncbi:MAG TPA: cytochrome c biogenesis protein CcsA [Alphaproteobacteria bacterium]